MTTGEAAATMTATIGEAAAVMTATMTAVVGELGTELLTTMLKNSILKY